MFETFMKIASIVIMIELIAGMTLFCFNWLHNSWFNFKNFRDINKQLKNGKIKWDGVRVSKNGIYPKAIKEIDDESN
ncbi:hypothetical protein JOC36_000825 [Weissella uvarum]|uniref:hypothetical protein n=1 Tax=Weissella uvarum TaxID=1479233 RepID=UPI00195F26DD|nr:hypothetical protein [Weissella uvarum]MBM7617276.1 hypothetical protein [Weissella uvarum]MCM0595220.1 hypothetical protein [Weissella uvarum]